MAGSPQQEPEAGFFTRAPHGGPQEPEEGEMVLDDSVIIAEIPAPFGKGLIRFIDENPGGDPVISVVEVGNKPALDVLIPDRPTALEVYMATAGGNTTAPARLVEEHALGAEGPPRQLLVNPAEEVDTWGPDCADAGYSAGFNAWASTVPAGNKSTVLNIKDVFSFAGNLSAYREIYAAACFESQADGHNNLQVRMRRNSGGGWVTVAGTQLMIEQHDRYRYFNNQQGCVNKPGRQIYVDQIGVSPSPDVFHVSGGWDAYFECNIQGL